MPDSQFAAALGGLADPGQGGLAAGSFSVWSRAETPGEPSARAPSHVRQLLMLERAGLISPGRAARSYAAAWRSIRRAAEGLEEMIAWLHRSRRFWERRIDRLDAHLRALQKPGKITGGNASDSKTTGGKHGGKP